MSHTQASKFETGCSTAAANDLALTISNDNAAYQYMVHVRNTGALHVIPGYVANYAKRNHIDATPADIEEVADYWLDNTNDAI